MCTIPYTFRGVMVHWVAGDGVVNWSLWGPNLTFSEHVARVTCTDLDVIFDLGCLRMLDDVGASAQGFHLAFGVS